MVVDGLPGSGLAGGLSIIVSGLVILATLVWSVRGQRSRKNSEKPAATV
jgi:hypothetical protein